ncbi:MULTISPECIES: hypothetical protein [Nocardia]|uniref:Uncharacterized protein n=1 Tax=Nocardia ignorata TaxID=145285 RepID=A0A4R6NXG7_NOCIG|nr:MULTISPECIES: hypothetical protein [Nocardia]TDP28711.1 hypothetical protein DFR75_11518 [Nocardia ignorata]
MEDAILQFLMENYEPGAAVGLHVGRVLFDLSSPLILAVLNFLAS